MGNRQPLPLPNWYDERLLGNPWYQGNAEIIQEEAYRIGAENNVKKATEDELTVLRLHIDQLTDFTWPMTSVDPFSGEVTRYIPEYAKGHHKIPEYWEKDLNNEVFWIEENFNLKTITSLFAGRLSVTGAWNDTLRSFLWDAHNAHGITRYCLSADGHPLTARFYFHFWRARENNPYKLPEGSHPYPYMDGSNQPFPIITPESCWHPVHNPDGYWKPIVTSRPDLDETWYLVKTLGFLVLWYKHCQKLTFGATIDPLITAVIMHHHFMRGGIETEPVISIKGKSWRTEFFGALKAEYEIFDDPDAQPNTEIIGLILKFDLIVISGQAASHCVLKTIQQIVEYLEKIGRDDAIKKIIYLKDTASIITGWEEKTAKALQELAAKGVQIQTTEDFNLYAA